MKITVLSMQVGVRKSFGAGRTVFSDEVLNLQLNKRIIISQTGGFL